MGAWNLAAPICDRQQAVVDVSTENADNFAGGMATFQCAERLALCVYRPESFVHSECDVRQC
jgi:hypothetical protein